MPTLLPSREDIIARDGRDAAELYDDLYSKPNYVPAEVRSHLTVIWQGVYRSILQRRNGITDQLRELVKSLSSTDIDFIRA